MSQTDLITAFQEEVARTFFDPPESEGFLLAGGAALIALGAVERVTDDLDFFAARGEGDVPAAKAAFVARCRDRGWQTVIVWEVDEFVRLSVVGADDKIEVGLGIDASLILPPTVTFLGPTIGLEENAGRKTLALFGRAAPRDFVDVFNLAQRFGKPKLLELAAERDLGFDRRVFGQMARMVNQINARQFPLDATEDELRDQVRSLLRLLRRYGSEFQTDIPAFAEAPPAVVDARAFLRSLEGTKAESEDYATTNLVDSADDRPWESFVQVAPYAFSAEFWQGSRYLVSLADECQSVVVCLVPESDIHAAVADQFDLRLLDWHAGSR